MSDNPPPAVDAYLAGVDPVAVPVVVALDSAVRSAHRDFDVAIKYGILMYALDGDWRTWVCAIEARKKVVSLRFLYGVVMDDPAAVLRKGSSVLMTWDLPFDGAVPVRSVRSYVKEAVAKYPEYKANAPEILAAARGR